jgi:anti-sigma factor ChrR (cupin superfamily)
MAKDIHADFTCRAAVHAQDNPWVPSPMPGVERQMLDRLGGEVARATTIVRYAPGSQFSPHTHDGGEEFIVLEGVFQDEHGDYPEGTYIRNPPTTHHTPRTLVGATILVKLWQFDPDDRANVHINTHAAGAVATPDRSSIRQIPLFQDSRETVRIELWEPHVKIEIRDHKGIEVFVLEGSFIEGGEPFVKHDWLRLPPGDVLHAVAGKDGARLWVKSGHLAAPQHAPGEAR